MSVYLYLPSLLNSLRTEYLFPVYFQELDLPARVTYSHSIEEGQVPFQVNKTIPPGLEPGIFWSEVIAFSIRPRGLIGNSLITCYINNMYREYSFPICLPQQLCTGKDNIAGLTYLVENARPITMLLRLHLSNTLTGRGRCSRLQCCWTSFHFCLSLKRSAQSTVQASNICCWGWEVADAWHRSRGSMDKASDYESGDS